ncbi:response regulator [candidate division KSB3 bacterium]|uniref:histidine kinase n=1 Tax=candidate division KSB3 bacterium TaxID=2044937 RepID=A0A9D5K0E5_9BACT|nr:response regulator [candidate division KSB3 bacterium]MBD3327662.1 response regulator [candidate division KSB3 bacterium]
MMQGKAMGYTNKILVVDDDPLNVKFLSKQLASEGYTIIQAYSGAEALEKVEQRIPDLILLDIMMPGIDGYEVTKQLKTDPKTQDIPIILITALHSPDDKIRGLEAGADEFLNKPVDTTELRARIRSLLSLKQYGEQLQNRVQSQQLVSGAAEPHPQLPSRPKTVLLVEDEEIVAHLMLSYLKHEPYALEHVRDGASAIERAKKGDIDLILLDLLLPGMDGFDVCQHLKQIPETQYIQIIIITCLEDMESKVRSLEMGADDFLVKPVSREELIARIKALLRKKDYFDTLITNYEKALHNAITDQLTGLYNHSYFKQFLELEIERSVRQNHPLTLLLLDIDDFKMYNDTLGHLIGDEILRELGQLIRESIRKIDLAARYGGEEFAIILPYTDSANAMTTAERIREMIASYPFIYKKFLASKRLTTSIGIADFQNDITRTEDLIERADKALYKAKHDGKNRVCLFEDHLFPLTPKHQRR